MSVVRKSARMSIGYGGSSKWLTALGLLAFVVGFVGWAFLGWEFGGDSGPIALALAGVCVIAAVVRTLDLI